MPQLTEFSVENDDFSTLEIRDSGNNSGFHYFFDTTTNRLITDFVLEDRPQVATLCQVTLIKKDAVYSPRIRLWKKDKTKLGKKVVDVGVSETDTTKLIKATVDTGDCYQNFWKVINFLQSLAGISLPDNRFRVVKEDDALLAKTLEGKDKQTIIEAVRDALGGELTDEDIRVMANRKAQLATFNKLLHDAAFFEDELARRGGSRREAVWQDYFEANPWIFGYGLNLIACQSLDERKLERITTGANIFAGAGKRSDAVLRSKGYISSLMFCEIKTHTTPLLTPKQYREPDVYQASKELSGGLSQVQKTADKATRALSAQFHRLYEDDGTPTGIDLASIRPRQVLVIGTLEEFAINGAVNPEKTLSFELFRRAINDVEIITFDELYERARFIVHDR